MRILVNQLVALGRRTGIGHYTSQLLRALGPLAAGDQIDAFPSGVLRRVCRTLTRARGLRHHVGAPGASGGSLVGVGLGSQTLGLLRPGARAVLERYFRTVCSRHSYDLYHEPNGIPFPVACPTVATLHDLSVLVHPQWHPPDRVALYEHHFRRGLARCVHLLVVSDSVRREVIRHLNFPADRVTRTYNGIRPGLRPMSGDEVEPVLRRLGLPSRYLLYVGTLEPRKNVLLLLRAYCALPESLRRKFPLLLVGGWGWNTAELAAYLHDQARHRGVLHLGYVKERHLAAVYNGARALVYPSWYEGFGLPPLEMMACGGAVLASTAAALVETTLGRAQLIPPGDFDGWRSALARVILDDDWWRALREGVRAVALRYSWEGCAADTLRVYRSLARTPAGGRAAG